jgi:transcriptional regulator with XRE-family HTH domain
MELSARIQAWRLHAGLSQRKLAALVDVSPASVCMWEKGQNIPSTRSLTRLVGVLGLTMLKFYGTPPKTKKAAA